MSVKIPVSHRFRADKTQPSCWEKWEGEMFTHLPFYPLVRAEESFYEEKKRLGLFDTTPEQIRLEQGRCTPDGSRTKDLENPDGGLRALFRKREEVRVLIRRRFIT